MPRISTLLSIVIHVIVIGSAVTWSVVAPGVLPIPRSMLAYYDVAMIKIADIPPPPVARRAAPESQTASADAAPLQPPDSILPDTGLKNVGARSGVTGDVPIADGLVGGLPGATGVIPPPPPPAAPPQVTPMRLHAGMQAPRKIVDVTPVYPTLALTARREGVVILEAVIDATGKVESVRVLKGFPLLDDAAVAAVRQWRFTPALLNGEPIPVVMTVTVNFSLK